MNLYEFEIREIGSVYVVANTEQDARRAAIKNSKWIGKVVITAMRLLAEDIVVVEDKNNAKTNNHSK